MKEDGTTTSSHMFQAYPKIIKNSAFMRLLPPDIVSVDKLHHVIIVIPPNDPKTETESLIKSRDFLLTRIH